jgi:dodecin
MAVVSCLGFLGGGVLVVCGGTFRGERGRRFAAGRGKKGLWSLSRWLGLAVYVGVRVGLAAGPAWDAVMGGEEDVMSTYKVIEVIGTSATSWEDAAAQAVKTAGETLHDLRVAEVVKQDIHVDEGGGITFRTKLELSFKYEHGR